MKNYNFTLRKETAGIFISRFKKLLSVTGAMRSNSQYTGAQAAYSLLKPIVGRKYRLPIVKLSDNYYLQDKTALFIGDNGVYVKITNDSGYLLEYGTKVKFTSNSVKFNRVNKHYGNSGCGYKSIISVYANVKSAATRVRMDEQYAEDYYKSVEEYWRHEEAQMFTELNEM